MQSTDDKVIAKIKKAKRSSLFFTENFLTFGTSKIIAKALERLVEKQDITRVDRGIYAHLQTHPEFGYYIHLPKLWNKLLQKVDFIA